MTSQSKDRQPNFEKDSSAGSQFGDEATSISDHETHNATNGSMVNISIASEVGQCPPGSREHGRELVYLSDLAADKQDSEVENSDRGRNRKGCTCKIGLGCCIFLACSLLCGTVLVSVGTGIAVHYLFTMFSG